MSNLVADLDAERPRNPQEALFVVLGRSSYRDIDLGFQYRWLRHGWCRSRNSLSTVRTCCAYRRSDRGKLCDGRLGDYALIHVHLGPQGARSLVPHVWRC